MGSTTLTTIAAFAIVFAAAGCGDDDGTPSGSAPTTRPGDEPAVTTAPSPTDAVPSAIADRRWVLTETVTVAGPQPVPDGTEATIMFRSDGEVEVDTGCNGGGGEASFDDDIVTVPLVVTEMACVDDDRMAVEGTMLTVLSSSMHWSVSDDVLSLTPTDITDSGLVLEDRGSSSDTADPGGAQDEDNRNTSEATANMRNAPG